MRAYSFFCGFVNALYSKGLKITRDGYCSAKFSSTLAIVVTVAVFDSAVTVGVVPELPETLELPETPETVEPAVVEPVPAVVIPRYSDSGTAETEARGSGVVSGRVKTVAGAVVVALVTGGTTTEIGGGSRFMSGSEATVFDVTGLGNETVSGSLSGTLQAVSISRDSRIGKTIFFKNLTPVIFNYRQYILIFV
jgi:hypothetical protein